MTCALLWLTTTLPISTSGSHVGPISSPNFAPAARAASRLSQYTISIHSPSSVSDRLRKRKPGCTLIQSLIFSLALSQSAAVLPCLKRKRTSSIVSDMFFSLLVMSKISTGEIYAPAADNVVAAVITSGVLSLYPRVPAADANGRVSPPPANAAPTVLLPLPITDSDWNTHRNVCPEHRRAP